MIETAAMDERARVASLEACGILDTPREAAFDNIVFTVAQLFRAPIAVMTLVGESRVWAKAMVGPLPQEMPRRETFCDALIDAGSMILIEDATTDARFIGLPLVTGEPHVRFCAVAPLHGPGQHIVGGLCVMDRMPRSIPDRQRLQLQQLAREASELLCLSHSRPGRVGAVVQVRCAP